MKIISWNVNGINACTRKGLVKFIKETDADIFCIQEIKASENKYPEEILTLKGYKKTWNSAKRAGYSGTLTLSKEDPISVEKGVGISEFDDEGRILITEHKNFYLLNCYFPNTKRDLSRLNFKVDFNEAIMKKCKELEKKKPVVLTGDLNVAHTELDIKNAKSNERNAGFTIEERKSFTKFLGKGFVDTFRLFNDEGGHYTWWSYMFNARAKDIGWRLDYFVVSESLKPKIKESNILKDVMGSDHCPVELILKGV